VLTFNLWGMRGDWPTRRKVLDEGLRDLAPDVVTFSEAILIDDHDQVRDVLGDGYHVAHQQVREPDGQGVSTASRWPIGQVREVDLQLGRRTARFAATSLITEILAPEPFGRIWLCNHLPDYRLDREAERRTQARRTASALEELAVLWPGHVIVAGDLDAEPESDSIRFWTGRHAVDGFSVCYRDAWAATHPGEPGHTFVPDNPNSADWDWPFRRIDYVLVRCLEHGGPSLRVAAAGLAFDRPGTEVSDHYALWADLAFVPGAAG
jgi:endonuclease/exonuclease/phosphatase family metal-dependent hydrolase